MSKNICENFIINRKVKSSDFLKWTHKTIEEELNGQIKELSGKFEIRETGITGKWEETIQAAQSATESKNSVTKMVGDFQVTAEHLTAEFSKTVSSSTADATGAINTAKESAVSAVELTAEGLTADFSKTVQTATTDSTGKITKAAETATSSLNRTAEELTDSFEQSFTDANGEITKQIKTQVTQNAKQWKVEVMGSDAQGNPNTILAAINADASGIKIKGDKVEIDGTLLAQIIMATGLNINDKFIVGKDGQVDMQGKFSTSIDGKRITIDPVDKSIRMYSDNKHLLYIGFNNVSMYTTPDITMYAYDKNGKEVGSTQVSPNGIVLIEGSIMESGWRKMDISAGGIVCFDKGVVSKTF